MLFSKVIQTTLVSLALIFKPDNVPNISMVFRAARRKLVEPSKKSVVSLANCVIFNSVLCTFIHLISEFSCMR